MRWSCMSAAWSWSWSSVIISDNRVNSKVLALNTVLVPATHQQ